MTNLGTIGLRYLPISELPEEWKNNSVNILCIHEDSIVPFVCYFMPETGEFWCDNYFGRSDTVYPTHFFPSVLDPIDPDEFVEVEAYSTDSDDEGVVGVYGKSTLEAEEAAVYYNDLIISTHTIYVPKRKIPHGVTS